MSGVFTVSHSQGMWASGLFVINPPWMLMPRMQAILPILAERLGEEGSFGFRCEELVGIRTGRVLVFCKHAQYSRVYVFNMVGFDTESFV